MNDQKDARQHAYLAQKALFNKFQNQTKQPIANAPQCGSDVVQSPSTDINLTDKTDAKVVNLISRDSLKMIVKKYGNEKCDPEVEEFLQDIVSDFLNETITASCKLAMHRKGDLLELKDVQMYLGI